MSNTFTAVFEQDGPWWIVYVEELPGANSQGATIDEARENLKEAIQLILETNREQSQQETANKPVVREPITLTLPPDTSGGFFSVFSVSEESLIIRDSSLR